MLKCGRWGVYKERVEGRKAYNNGQEAISIINPDKNYSYLDYWYFSEYEHPFSGQRDLNNKLLRDFTAQMEQSFSVTKHNIDHNLTCINCYRVVQLITMNLQKKDPYS